MQVVWHSEQDSKLRPIHFFPWQLKYLVQEKSQIYVLFNNFHLRFFETKGLAVASYFVSRHEFSFNLKIA